MQIHIQSFEPAFGKLYQNIAKSLPRKVELIWSFQKKMTRFHSEQFMQLLIGGIDAVLVPINKVKYPLNHESKVVAVFENKNDVQNPLLLIVLSAEKKSLFADFHNDLRKKYGKVYIAGFGPGNPELLTLKTQGLIKEAHVIYYDDLLDNKYLEQYQAKLVYVGKRKGKHSTGQDQINQLLYQSALNGQTVLRLKGGDPLIFGRGAEEYQYLNQRQVEAEIVPGVTSALAAAADAVVPLTSRGLSTSVAFALGHDATFNKLPKADTLVFYMGASQQRAWAKRLINEGWESHTPVVCIRNASLSNKEIRPYTLSELLKSETVLPAPALLIVGKTAARQMTGEVNKWLYTGTDLTYFKEKGDVVHNPMVKIEELPLTNDQERLIHNVKAFDRVFFVSPHAVHQFFKALFKRGLDARVLFSSHINSIGPSTSKALKEYGLVVAPVSDTNSAKGFIDHLKAMKVKEESILLPCSDRGLSYVSNELLLLNNEVHEFKIYRSVLPDNAVRHNLDDFHGIVFTSPTAVHHFFKLHAQLPDEMVLKARGQLTYEVLQHYVSELNSKDISIFAEEIRA